MVQLLILYCLKYISGVLLVILISVGSNFDGSLSGVHDCEEHADNVHCADRDEQGDRDEEDTGGNNFRIAEKDCGVKADIEIRTFAEVIVHDFFGTLGDRKGTVLCLLLSPPVSRKTDFSTSSL